MALATKCPHCNTIFRVAADQLKLRGGIVRCGACHEVFDGNAALVEPAAKPTPVIPDVPTAPEPAAPSVSDYVHGSAVDFEFDFADDPAVPAAAAEPSAAPPQPDLAAPAVWRTAAVSPGAEEAAPFTSEASPAITPSPEDLAQAAVARAFAAVTSPAPAEPVAAAASEAAPAPPEEVLPWEEAPAAEAGTAPAEAGVTGTAADMAADADAAATEADLAAADADVAPAEADVPAAEVDWAVDEAGLVAAEADVAGAEGGLAADEADFAAAEAGLPTTEDVPQAAESPGPPSEAPSAADTAAQPDFVPAFLRARPAPVDADEPAPAGNIHPDGRIEPTLDTPQEHIVAAALDDAHHFEDLPLDEEQRPASEPAVGREEAGEAWSGDETWSAPAAEPTPAEEPWSLSEPEQERDETALHAVAAVNTDVPDDGASLPDDEQPAGEPAMSRRERALKRAKSRRDASGPAQLPPDDDPAADQGDDMPASDAAAARMRALAGDDEAGESLDHSDLSFVKRVDRSQKYGKAVRLTMAFGIPVLLAGLVLQAATTFRDTLAASYPQLKPALAAICQPFGCAIALPAQLDALSIEQGELASMAENTFSFSTVLRNQSKTPQAWPHIELTLNDNADKPVLRRVFSPREYLPSPAEAEKGFSPRSEQSVKLYFELKELKASGYHISIFYP